MITNGTVTIEDGMKAAEEYAPARKVRVELSFDYDDLDRVSIIAQAKVAELLGKPKHTVAAAATPVEEIKKAPPRKKVETLPPVESFPLGNEAEAQPAGQADETGLGDSVLGNAEPKVDLSDKALFEVVVATNVKVKKPKEITALISKYCPADGVPPSLKRVPEAKRVEFINELKAIAAANTAK